MYLADVEWYERYLLDFCARSLPISNHSIKVGQVRSICLLLKIKEEKYLQTQ